MRPGIVVRSETDADVGAIADVTVAAFSTLPISNHTEQFIIAAPQGNVEFDDGFKAAG